MSDPHSERLLAAAEAASANHNQTHQQLFAKGSGGRERPVGSPNVEAMVNASGKAASLVICYFGSKYKHLTDRELLEMVKLPLQATYFGLLQESDLSTVRQFLDKITGQKGGWDKYRKAEGFGEGIFGEMVLDLKSSLIGGGLGDDALRKEQFAVATLASFASAKVAGETNINNLSTVYIGVFNFMNQWFMGFGEQATPGMPPINMPGQKLMELASNNYAPMFGEIEFMSPKTEGIPATMFGFEDLTEVFMQHPIDPQLMKDSELQTYTLRGEIVYDRWWWYDVPMCEDQYVGIKNPGGKITGYNNIGPISFPCVDESRNAVPVTGTLFERHFVEAPPVSGTYDHGMMSYITTKTQEAYPHVAYYDSDFSADQPEFVDGDGRWITRYGWNMATYHWITDASNYEPYYFINNFESNAGSPGPGFVCSLSSANGYGGFCENNYHGDSQWHPLEEMCTGAGWNWWTPEQACLHVVPPTPSPFPGQTFGAGGFNGEVKAVRDMSMRHHLLKEDADPSVHYKDDHTQIEHTGFVMAPLMFTPDRLSGLYRNHKTNPNVDFGNLGRRAFSYSAEPTCAFVSGTCGPPQQFAHPITSSNNYNHDGGPFVYAQIHIENKTKKQRCKVELFPGWAYRYSEDPYGTFDYHRTGGWNFPLIDVSYSVGYSDPEDGFWKGEPFVEFNGRTISNDFKDRDFRYEGEKQYYRTGMFETWFKAGESDSLPTPYDPSPPDPWHYNQELITPQKFFGMGDNCQNIPVGTTYSLNAGVRYSFHDIDITGITHPWLTGFTGEINKSNEEGLGCEAYWTRGMLGQYGESYWNEYVTGWIHTGDYAGEMVSCMHPRTGYSIGFGKVDQREYWWLGTGVNDVHYAFPYKGIDCLTNFGPLSPYPNYSKCCDIGFSAPFQGTTTTTTTTTTVDPNGTTTTTCDPSDPNCGFNTTTTTTTMDPSMILCKEGDPGSKLLTCPEGKAPSMGYTEDGWVCNWDQCVSAGCDVFVPELWMYEMAPWDSGIFPHQVGWAEQTVKQRGENPPRYWHGPYASTHFSFMYPNGSGAMERHYPKNQGLEMEGFPWRIHFEVEVEEYTVRNFVSGGYIGDDGGVKWNEKVVNEAGKAGEPQWLEENTGYNWGNLVDENFAPDEAVTDNKCTHANVVLNWALANGRNNERYSGAVEFDRGNQLVSGKAYAYGTKCEDAINRHTMHPRAGYNRYTGYKFPITATYGLPSYNLTTHTVDYSSIQSGLQAGNELFYKCNQVLTVGRAGEVDTDPTLDPVYFMPMNSNLKDTGVFDTAVLHNEYVPFTGSTIHQKQIYGDHWIGLRPGSLFAQYEYELLSGYNGANLMSPVAGSPGSLVTCATGAWSKHSTDYDVPFNTGYDPLKMIEDLGGLFGADDNSLYWCENLSNLYGTCSGVKGPPALKEVVISEYPCLQITDDIVRGCDNRVYLFNVHPTGLDVHVRAPDYLSGYITEANEYAIVQPEDLMPIGMGLGHSATFSLSISGTNTYVRMVQDEEQGNMLASYASSNNKQIDFFKRDWADEREINYEGIIYEKEGILFEEPSSDWEMGVNQNGEVTGYETILQHGKRIFENDGTKLRASGWVETSKIKIKITDINIDSYGHVPFDSYFAMTPSGNCQVSGTLQYMYQNEAAIYSEGIVFEDKSVDPLRDILNYPHYASETIQRPGIELPTGHNEMGEYIPEFEILTKNIRLAPSKMIVRRNELWTVGSGFANYEEIYRDDPHYYNRYVWPTMSDMADWNGGDLSWESLPPLDSITYPVSNLMICAAAGQPTADLEESELITRKYAVTQHYAFYDTVVLDPTINKDWMVKLDTEFDTVANTSYLVPAGTTVQDIKQGITMARKTVLGEDDDKSTIVGILKGG